MTDRPRLCKQGSHRVEQCSRSTVDGLPQLRILFLADLMCGRDHTARGGAPERPGSASEAIVFGSRLRRRELRPPDGTGTIDTMATDGSEATEGVQ